MAEVRIKTNEWRQEDGELAARIEHEVTRVISRLGGKGSIDCRILIEPGPPRRVRVELERPGWLVEFAVPAPALSSGPPGTEAFRAPGPPLDLL